MRNVKNKTQISTYEVEVMNLSATDRLKVTLFNSNITLLPTSSNYCNDQRIRISMGKHHADTYGQILSNLKDGSLRPIECQQVIISSTTEKQLATQYHFRKYSDIGEEILYGKIASLRTVADGSCVINYPFKITADSRFGFTIEPSTRVLVIFACGFIYQDHDIINNYD